METQAAAIDHCYSPFAILELKSKLVSKVECSSQ